MTALHILARSKLQSYFTHHAPDPNKIRRPRLSLKSLIASAVLASTPLGAQQPTPEPTVIAGSEVSLSAITKTDWIQGEGPKSFEPGKVYIFECWATWCGPCIGMIPHVNELHKKYHDKGLRVYGISVWENDQDKVKKFVKKMGDRMTYPVAFTGKGAAFETEWMTAAGVKSIPHAFIVRDGKLLASTQASRLTDALIETLLSGDEGAKKAADTISSAQNHQGKTSKLVQDILSARSKKDPKKMTTLIQELKSIDPDHPEIPTLELRLLITNKEWPAAVTALNEMPASESKKNFVLMTSMRAAMQNSPNYPTDFTKALAKSYSDYVMLSELPIGPNHFACLSILQWRLDDQQNALITADKGVESAKTFSKGNESRTKAFERFAKSVNEGTMPQFSDLSKWQRETKVKATDSKPQNQKD